MIHRTIVVALVFAASASAAPPGPPQSPLHTPPQPFRHPPRVTVSRDGAIKVTVSGVASGGGYLTVSAYYGKAASKSYGGAVHYVANVRKATMTLHPNHVAKRTLRARRTLAVMLFITLVESRGQVLEGTSKTVQIAGMGH